MDALKRAHGTVKGKLWERETFNVGFGTYSTRRGNGVIKIKAINGLSEPFYAYMTHQAV